MRMTLLLIILIFLTQSCTTGSANYQNNFDDSHNTVSLKKNVEDSKTPQKAINYSLYIDNSYSMKGYFKGASNFLSTINKLVIHLSNESEDHHTSCDLHYVNNGISHFGNANNENVADFLGKINNFFADENSTNRKVTDLKDVMKVIIDSLQPNSVNIIVTDGIPSPGLTGQASATYLDILQNCIFKSVYSKLTRFDFTTQIIKCKSGFNGVYVNQLNKGVALNDAERPYYIFLMGNEYAINKLTEFIIYSIESSQYQSIVSFNNLHKNNVNSKVLIGSGYEISGNASSLKIHKTEENTNEVNLKLLADFSNLPLNEDYLTNSENYSVYPEDGHIQISKIVNKEDPLNKGFTHKIILKLPNLYTRQSVNIKLKYKLPEWVHETNTEQDLSLSDSELKQKTFGFLYIVNGFMDGYKERKLIDQYFNLNITNQ